MSGKSTLLRSVGINTVLAMAGAPVRAKSLRLSPLQVGTRIHSTDSLQEGRSTFFAEILHIRRVFDLAATSTNSTAPNASDQQNRTTQAAAGEHLPATQASPAELASDSTSSTVIYSFVR